MATPSSRRGACVDTSFVGARGRRGGVLVEARGLCTRAVVDAQGLCGGVLVVVGKRCGGGARRRGAGVAVSSSGRRGGVTAPSSRALWPRPRRGVTFACGGTVTRLLAALECLMR